MIYGYARVSTVKQIAGNSLEEQEAILRKNDCQQIVVEQYTGKTTDRPKLNELISKLTAGDKLVVTKLDRLARTATEGNDLIQDLISRDITVTIDNMGTISSKPMDKLMVTVLLAFAEFERSMIIERTQAGKAIARTKDGYQDGRPKKYTKYQLQSALALLDEHSYTQVERMTGISKSTLIREKRQQGGTQA
ncbi:MAG: resolvase [Firmicutes bacterium]|nr:resolvase [Bacillota bacterium]